MEYLTLYRIKILILLLIKFYNKKVNKIFVFIRNENKQYNKL